MNKTKIDWCDSSWNPITGCRHNCKYCYARDIADRFSQRKGYILDDLNCDVRYIFNFRGNGTLYELNSPCYCIKEEEYYYEKERTENKIRMPYPFAFSPTFHKYKLNEYINKKGRNIFVCSMADLFGSWVPDEWITEVFDACKKAPQHNYLFLTKNPDRYLYLLMEDLLPEHKNMWYGITVTNSGQARKAEQIMQDMSDAAGAFLSIEPIMEDISKDLETVIGNFTDWVIIGAETGKRKNKIIPNRNWIEKIVDLCKAADIPVFMKDNLKEIWDKPLIREFPKELERRNDYG